MVAWIALAVACMAWIMSIVKVHSDTPPGSLWQVPPTTMADTLAELKAKEDLEKDYKWVVPKYNKFRGASIPDKDVTNDMKMDITFLSRQAQGRWVKK